MRIRVFTEEDRGLKKYLNFLRLEMGNKDWVIEICDPLRWIAEEPADIHLYVDIPVRQAIPWAGFNAFSVLDLPHDYEWTRAEMDLMVDRDALEEREGALKALRGLIHAAQKKQGQPTLPSPPPRGTLPPKVGIVTVTRNRPEWFFNMVQNITTQQWPISRMEWIIVDDSDSEKRVQNLVYDLEKRVPALTIKYVMMKSGATIGEKRNRAVEEASEDTTHFVMMDDDDHYPASSVAVRMSWLRRAPIVYCATIPMYDICRYISAMNVPPMDQGPCARISEATLAFTRDAWVAQPFLATSVAEGMGFLYGREGESVEIPPSGVIVSFIHKANSTSRRTPEDAEPNGCHYGFSDDYFRWISECGGATKEPDVRAGVEKKETTGAEAQKTDQ
jgi:hypothetical protein